MPISSKSLVKNCFKILSYVPLFLPNLFFVMIGRRLGCWKEYILSEDLKAPGKFLAFCGLGSAKFAEQFPACPQAALPSRKRAGRIYCLPEYSRLSLVIVLWLLWLHSGQNPPPSPCLMKRWGANSWTTWSNGIGLDYGFLISFLFLILFFFFFLFFTHFQWKTSCLHRLKHLKSFQTRWAMCTKLIFTWFLYFWETEAGRIAETGLPESVTLGFEFQLWHFGPVI